MQCWHSADGKRQNRDDLSVCSWTVEGCIQVEVFVDHSGAARDGIMGEEIMRALFQNYLTNTD